MKTKYNQNLEIKRFLNLYLHIWAWLITIPLVVILTPVITFVDWLLSKCRYGYWGQLYRNYIELTNMRIDL